MYGHLPPKLVPPMNGKSNTTPTLFLFLEITDPVKPNGTGLEYVEFILITLSSSY